MDSIEREPGKPNTLAGPMDIESMLREWSWK